MGDFTQKLYEADYTGRIFTETQLAHVLGGSDARRYGLVNRALKEGTLLRIRRGLYCMNPRSPARDLAPPGVHAFAIAQGLLPGSYVTFETALSHHGWIPEVVYQTASATPFRKGLAFETQTLGSYSFTPIALNDYQFLVGVDRLKIGRLTGLIAKPLRALMDLVATRKLPWQGLDWIVKGMRIDRARLQELTIGDFVPLSRVYKHKSTRAFLAHLRDDVVALKATQPLETDTEIGGLDD